MNIKEVLSKKKYGGKLSKEEIDFFVQGYTNGDIPDYQAAAFLMSVYFNGMDGEETAMLTDSMVRSGDQLDLSVVKGIKADKHSTGGVGDKITLIVMPIMAELGIKTAKMSGRGLGHTGGTIDKLESIEGFSTELPLDVFLKNVEKEGFAIASQTGSLAPADKKIYALRDVIECVDSIPLIASSIMSKKIASGADVIVLDVKVGEGAFMKDVEQARALAETMVGIGKALGRNVSAVLTAMEQPLGREVGNACEVAEAIEVLRGGGTDDEKQVAIELASHMAVGSGTFDSLEEARARVAQILADGTALKHFRRLVEVQGGDVSFVDHPEKLMEGVVGEEVLSEESGYITGMHAEKVGKAASLLGAGRMKKGDVIDGKAGVRCLKKVGEHVEKGEAVFLVRGERGVAEAKEMLLSSLRFSQEKPREKSSILGVVQ